MNKKKMLIIVCAIVMIIGYLYLTSNSNSSGETEDITPTPIAEESIYVTFDGNGGYTVLKHDYSSTLQPEFLEKLSDADIKKQLISFYPDILTLIGNYESTSLYELASKPNRTCLFSCVEVFPETDELTGIPKTSEDIYIYELAGLTEAHIYEGITKQWLFKLKKAAFLKYRADEEDELPPSVKNTLTYTERMLEDSLRVHITETNNKIYSVAGEEYPIYEAKYNIDLNKNIVTLFNSYIVNIDGRYLEVCFTPKDLSNFELNIDLSTDYDSTDEITDDEILDSGEIEVIEDENLNDIFKEDIETSEEIEDVFISVMDYTTYAEYLDIAAPIIANNLKAYLENDLDNDSDLPDSNDSQIDNKTDSIGVDVLDTVFVKTNAKDHINNILIGDYHVLDFAKEKAPVLNVGSDTTTTITQAPVSNTEESNHDEDSFFKKNLSKIPFLNKEQDDAPVDTDTPESQDGNAENVE